MPANYERPAFTGPMWKPERGSRVIAREEQREEESAELIAAKKAAKLRDGHRCCWPEKHKCRGGIESAHIVDKSRGGPDTTANLITICAWMHRRGPKSIHSKDCVVQPLTDRGADGPVAYYRTVWNEGKRGGESLRLVALEVSCRVLERYP